MPYLEHLLALVSTELCFSDLLATVLLGFFDPAGLTPEALADYRSLGDPLLRDCRFRPRPPPAQSVPTRAGVSAHTLSSGAWLRAGYWLDLRLAAF